MSLTAFVFLVLGILGACAFMAIKIKLGDGNAATVIKQLASVLFVELACICVAEYPTGTGVKLILALVLGMIGDVMLAVSASSVNGKDMLFMTGMGAFALEHITVIVTLMTFMPGTVSWVQLLIGLGCGTVFGAVSVFGTSKLRLLNYGDMLIPTFIYCSLLSTSAFFCLAAAFVTPMFILPAIAMICFLISDLHSRFHSSEPLTTPLPSL